MPITRVLRETGTELTLHLGRKYYGGEPGFYSVSTLIFRRYRFRYRASRRLTRYFIIDLSTCLVLSRTSASEDLSGTLCHHFGRDTH
jgi:hypothetical protein